MSEELKKLTKEYNKLLVTFNDSCIEISRLVQELTMERAANKLLSKKLEQGIEYQNSLLHKIITAKEMLK